MEISGNNELWFLMEKLAHRQWISIYGYCGIILPFPVSYPKLGHKTEVKGYTNIITKAYFVPFVIQIYIFTHIVLVASYIKMSCL